MSKVQIIILLSIVFQINSCKNKNGYEQFIDNLKIGQYDTVYVVSSVSCGGCITDFFENREFSKKSILVFDEQSSHQSMSKMLNLNHINVSQQYLDSTFDYFGNVIILTKVADSMQMSTYPNN
jgi:hypothetical protein